MLKYAYNSADKLLKNLRLFLYRAKVWIWEWISILSKKDLLTSVEHSNEQKNAIQSFWKKAYGKSIPTHWHRLYQSINGVFDERYVPDIIFSTYMEVRLNDIEYAKLYSDKGLTELLYSGETCVAFPKTILLCSGGHFYDGDRRLVGRSQALSILSQAADFVIKPTLGGSSGRSVRVIEREEFDAESLMAQYRDDYIVQEKLRPHIAFSEIYPDSINTLRLITYIAGDTIKHAPLCLRIGTSGKRVDNIHSGGLVIGVSDEGFLLERAYRLGYCDSKEVFLKHPDSGLLFANYELPYISDVIEIGKRLHCMTPKIGVISWDFMINEGGDVVLVEGNYMGQSVWFPQIVHGKPIFGDNFSRIIDSLNNRF